MVSVRHGELATVRWRGTGKLRQEVDRAGPGGPVSGVWPPLGPPPCWQQQWGGQVHFHPEPFYLLGFGFDLSMGESFQKDRWLDAQELNEWKPKCHSVTRFYLLAYKEFVEFPGAGFSALADNRALMQNRPH